MNPRTWSIPAHAPLAAPISQGCRVSARRKGHHYLTVVLDLDTGHVLYTAPGNDHSCLEQFFQRLKKARSRLRAIAVDMSRGYTWALA
ncbi:MAG: transposase [bacterium]